MIDYLDVADSTYPQPFSMTTGSTITPRFTWTRPTAFPVWVDGHPHWEYLSEDALERAESSKGRWMLVTGTDEYRPLEEAPEMFREFLSAERNEKSFSEFAARYGPLGVDVTIIVDGKQRPKNGEAFYRWAHEQAWLMTVWTVAEAIRRRQHQTLARWIITRRNAGQYAIRIGPTDAQPLLMKAQRLIASREGPSRLLPYDQVAAFPANDRNLMVARAWVAAEVSRRLSTDATASNLELAVDGPAFALSYHPTTLIGAMWLQLAQYLEGNSRFRRCQYRQCSRWFQISTEGTGRRIVAKYCSARCRLKQFRQQQRNGI